MLARELRIGNYVIDDIFLYTISGIDLHSVWGQIESVNNTARARIEDFYEDGNYHLNIENIEPIPLTEEWLIKFGFEKIKDEVSPYKDGEYTITSKRFTVFRKYPITHNSVFGWYIKKINFSEINIKYVHQLQNLYFALSGKELIVGA